jgi:hypothetical protein
MLTCLETIEGKCNYKFFIPRLAVWEFWMNRE